MQRLGRFLSVLIVALLPLYYVKLTIFDLPTNVIELLVAVVFTSAMFSEVPNKKPINPLLITGTVLLIIGAGIGVLVAEDTRVALGILKGWFVIPAAFGFAIWKLFDNKTVNQLFQGAVFSTITVSVYAILQWYGYLPLIAHQNIGGNLNQYIEQGRALGFFESPNYLSMYLVPLVAISGSYVWSKTRSIALLLITVLPALIAVYLSGSRAGLLAAGVVVLVSLLWKRSVKSVLVITALLLAIIAVTSLSAPKNNTGDQARVFIWRQGTKMVIEEPLTGIGPGQFQRELNERLPNDSYYQNEVRSYALHPHNLFLNSWLSAGVLGLIGMVILILNIIISGSVELHISRFRVGILAAVAAIATHGLFDSTYFKNDLAIIFFLLIALWQVCENTGKRYDAS